MKSPSFAPQDTYIRTPQGEQVLTEQISPISKGLRQFLELLDGTRTLEQVSGILKQLDQKDLMLWLAHLLDKGFIQLLPEPFILPESPVASRSENKKVPPKNPVREFNLEVMVEELVDWAQKETLASSSLAQTKETARSVALYATRNLPILQKTGVLSTLNPNQPPPSPPEITSPAIEKRAVIFEYNPKDLTLLGKLLKSMGYTIGLSSSSKQLANLLSQAPIPQVIFLRDGSPELDIIKVIQQIRKHRQLNKTRVILMLNEVSEEKIAKISLAGGSGCILPPYNSEKIALAMDQLMP